MGAELRPILLPHRNLQAMKNKLTPRFSILLLGFCACALLASCNTSPQPRPGGPTSNLDPKAWNKPQPWEGGAQFGMFPQSR